MSEATAGNQDVAGPPPITIAKQFIKQYYPNLTLNPQKLQHFYHPTNSFLSFTVRPEDCEGASVAGNGTQGRRFDDVLAAGTWNFCRGAKMDLAGGFIDAQKTHDGGVVIVVYGEMILRKGWDADIDDTETAFDAKMNGLQYESLRRKFIHTFVLARGSGPKKSLYVSNDVFRFLDLDQSAEEEEIESEVVQQTDTKDLEEEEIQEEESHFVEELEEKPLSPPPTPVDDVVESEPTTENEAEEAVAPYEASTEADEETEAVEETKEEEIVAKENGSTAVSKQSSGPENSPVAPPQAAVLEAEKTTALAPPSSWASLVAGAKSEGAEESTEAGIAEGQHESKSRASTEKAGVANKKITSNPRAKVQLSSISKPSSSVSKREGKQGIPAGHSNVATSVYIRNVPGGTKEEHLLQLFNKAFPSEKIAHVAVYANRGFAFIEFAKKESVQAVLKGATVKKVDCTWTKGVVLEIEAKKTERYHASSNAPKSSSNTAGASGGSRYKGGSKHHHDMGSGDGKGSGGNRGKFERESGKRRD